MHRPLTRALWDYKQHVPWRRKSRHNGRLIYKWCCPYRNRTHRMLFWPQYLWYGQIDKSYGPLDSFQTCYLLHVSAISIAVEHFKYNLFGMSMRIVFFFILLFQSFWFHILLSCRLERKSSLFGNLYKLCNSPKYIYSYFIHRLYCLWRSSESGQLSCEPHWRKTGADVITIVRVDIVAEIFTVFHFYNIFFVN